MKVNTINAYLIAKFKEEQEQQLQSDFNSQKFTEMITLYFKANWNKDIKSKSWLEIKESMWKEQEEEKTAEQIEKELIEKLG